MALGEFERKYLADVEATRAKRMAWWQAARFGMFIHWGLYSQVGRNEWVMNLERIPLAQYEKLADSWRPKPGAIRAWARLAPRQAGMKYMVMTTKHHEGFCLWDTKMTAYNAVQRGPGRDLVREYVDAVRAEGLKVGFYYSLMDWHHPDGARSATDEAARLRFTQFTQGCVRELCSNYGKIDILWYDVSWPLSSPEAWDSYRMNDMARKLQLGIIINDRSQIPEDLGTPEEHITAANVGRSWEACMTFNGSWGWQQTPPEDWHSTRKVLEMLRTVTAGQGNLLLNVGPLHDGSLPAEAVERLTKVGKWLSVYGDAVYGVVDRAPPLVSAVGNWTRKGKKLYYWCTRWPGKELAIGALAVKLKSARLFPSGKKLDFEQTRDRLVIKGLPANCPDKVAHVGMLELVFNGPIHQWFSAGCVMAEPENVLDVSGKWFSKAVAPWQVSRVLPNKDGVAKAPPRRLSEKLGWQAVQAGVPDGFVNVHDRALNADGLIYFANRFKVEKAGKWTAHLGHDGGARLFVDGKAVAGDPVARNPARPGRSSATLSLSKGAHEVVIAFDTAGGKGWGIFFHWEVPKAARKKGVEPVFPTLLLGV